jgi:hypothetical protein
VERGPLSLMSTSEELLGRNGSGCGLENREYGRREPSRSPRGTLSPQKLALTSPTSGRSLGRCSSLTDSGHGVRFVSYVFYVSPAFICKLHIQTYIASLPFRKAHGVFRAISTANHRILCFALTVARRG